MVHGKTAEVAEFLSPQVGIDPKLMETIVRRQPSGFKPIDASVISDQQRIADAFFQLNLIPKPVDVREAVLPHNENHYAKVEEEGRTPGRYVGSLL